MDPVVVQVAAHRPRHGSQPLSTWLALILVIVTGVNIRAIFGVTPPLIPTITHDLALSATTASLLTSMPILAMAACAPLGHVLSTRLGADWAMVWLLAFLSLSELSRIVMDSATLLVVSAGLIGGALGALSTLTPALIAHYLPRLPGLATGIYSTSMALGVGLAAGTAQPFAMHLGGWRVALAVWGLLGFVLIAATLAARWHGAGMPEERPTAPLSVSLPLRDPRAWFLTATYAVPMFTGFGVIAWMPTLFIDHGTAPARAAIYLVYFQFIQLVSILSLTALTDRISGRRGVFGIAILTSTLGIGLMAHQPHDWAIPGLLLAGFGIGGLSSLALVKVQDEATSPQDATRLSAMAMLFSFTAGAAGPFLMGVLKDITGSLVPGFWLCFWISAASVALLVWMKPATPDP